MKRILLAGSIILILIVAAILLPGSRLAQAGQVLDRANKPTPPPPISKEDEDGIVDAIFKAMQDRAEEQPVFLVTNQRVENVTLAHDRMWASAWMIPVDQATGETIETEPGLVLLQRIGKSWQVAFPSDPSWLLWLHSLPEDVLGEGGKAYWLELYAQYQDELLTAPIGGYLLPWERGVTGNMTGSYVHDGYIQSCTAHYAFDFTITDPLTGRGGLFTILAARGGTVFLMKDDQPLGSTDAPGNYIVLKDTSTTPITYQLYLHLAPASIPTAIRWIGAPVHQGQIIGVADDTGASSGHHLHFMVHTNPYYWGQSVDITFDDVDINGGRPRIRWFIGNPDWDDFMFCNAWPCYYSSDVCNDYRNTYVSQNILWDDFTGPTGGLTTPANFATITSNTLSYNGWAEDNGSGVKTAQLLAAWNGTFTLVGQEFTTTSFAGSWDMCANQVPNGAVSLGLKLLDWKGNVSTLTGLRTVLKDTTCPPPAPTCSPNANQVALFAEPNYQGDCQVFGAGTYDSSALTIIGNDNTASVMVGANMRATLSYNALSNNTFNLRAETLSTSDPNLSDNAISSDTTSALKVMAKTSLPAVPLPTFPASGSVITQTQSLSLYSIDQGGAEQFQVELIGTQTYTSTWQTGSTWSLGSGPGSSHLPAGPYSWRVRAKNTTGDSVWSTPVAFTIAAYTPSVPSSITVPFTHTMNGGDGWYGSGLWHLEADRPDLSTYTWWYGQGSPGSENYEGKSSGDLTSPPFDPSGSPYLRIKYSYQTETQAKFWDQRWLQVSADGGPFTNLYQFSDDPMIINDPHYVPWLISPVIDLSVYAGHTIQLRLHFEPIYPFSKGVTNNNQGWYIDEVSVTNSPAVTCPSESGEPNDSTLTATLLGYSTTPISAAICPGGDFDYYSFFGTAADRVVADIDTGTGSQLDGVLDLLDSDGNSILIENDDEDYPDNLDPYLSFLLPRSDTYYLKLKAWDHPSGSAAHTYDLKLTNDKLAPSLTINYPKQGNTITQTVILSANVLDSGSGLVSVAFYLHDNDWSDPLWTSVGTDLDGSDGWSVTPDLSWLGDQSNAAVMAIAMDKAGNTKAAWETGIKVDRTAPNTKINTVNGKPAQSAGIPITYTLEANIFKLVWNGSDAFSGLDHFDLQKSLDSGAWSDYLMALPPSETSSWEIAPAGSALHSYRYRVRGVDLVGNIEPYPISDADIIVPAAVDLCSSLDPYEIELDNESNLASIFDLNIGSQRHNLCNPFGNYFQDDVDWVQVDLSAGITYYIQVLPEAQFVAVETRLYASDASTLKMIYTPQVYGEPALLIYTPSIDETVYLRLNHINPQVIGNAAGYKLLISDIFSGSFLPLVYKLYVP
jgi:hypothetical protein